MARSVAPLLAAIQVLCSCGRAPSFDADQIAQGPGGMVGNGAPITDGNFQGGNDPLPNPRVTPPPDDTRPPDCNSACAAFCDALPLDNPINRGLCRSLWGVGLASRPIDPTLACRRMFIDVVGRLPLPDEAAATCTGNWGETAKKLMADPAFVFVNQRRAADTFLYATRSINVSRIYDMDRLVGKLHQGLVPYDLYAAVASVHPVLTRRFASASDTVDAAFKLFLGRPPYANERADMSRLYRPWYSGYLEHPQLFARVPDAFVRFNCVNSPGECTSLLWGYNPLVLSPDIRATPNPENRQLLLLWSGLLTPEEWTQLQIPGRILASQVAFWEKAVSDVVVQYLGYDLTQLVPGVREELVRYLLRYNGDIRSVHFAVTTSIAYLQTHEGASAARYPWTFGPMKQMNAEAWLDSLARNASKSVSSCDHRISDPRDFLRSSSLNGYRLVQKSRWTILDSGDIDESYADTARTLGGCPENTAGGRFKILSILTTAAELSYVNGICNFEQDSRIQSPPIEVLLPSGITASQTIDATTAAQIAEYQYSLFLGRPPNATERSEAVGVATDCAGCTAETFGRAVCFGLLSSSNLLFY